MKINGDIQIQGTNIDSHSYIPDSIISKTAINSLYWYTNTSGWDNQLNEFKTWLTSSGAPTGAYLVQMSFNGSMLAAFIQKANNSYLSALLFSYMSNPQFIMYDGNWSQIPIPSGIVEKSYLGQNPDIDNYKKTSGIYGLYACSKAPVGSIGVLEVLFYSPDWVIQRFTDIEGQRMWERCFKYGTTWSSWVQRW